MDKIAWSVGVACGISLETACATPSTNLPPPVSSAWATNTLMVSQHIPSSRLSERWLEELIPSGRRIVYDRHDAPSLFYWIQSYDEQGYEIHEYIAEYGQRTTLKIMGSAAREAALQTLPLQEFLQDGEELSGNIRRFFAGFLYGSLANAEEEDTTTVSSTPSYSSLKYIVDFEWNEPSDAWSGEYGWRPWRDNPYAYLNVNLGHHCGRQFLRMEGRCYGYLRPNDFGVVKTEARAIVTLAQRSQLVIGGFLYPLEDDPEYKPQASIRFETFWRQNILSVGVASTLRGPFWNMSVERRF